MLYVFILLNLIRELTAYNHDFQLKVFVYAFNSIYNFIFGSPLHFLCNSSNVPGFPIGGVGMIFSCGVVVSGGGAVRGGEGGGEPGNELEGGLDA